MEFDLIKRALNGASFQYYVNTLFAEKYNKPNVNGFKFADEMVMDFDVKQMSARIMPYTMASVVDIQAPAPLKHTEGVTLGEVTIPRMKHGFNIDEKGLRQKMILMQRFNSFTDGMAKAVERNLFNSVDQLLGGHEVSLKFQRGQAVSKHCLEFISENNPQGVKGVKIDFYCPKDNEWEKAWWRKNGTKGTSITPLKDLKEKVDYIRENQLSPLDHIEVNVKTFRAFLELPEVRTFVGFRKNSLLTKNADALAVGNNLGEDECKRIIEVYLGVPISVQDDVCAVEKWDEKENKVKIQSLYAFAEDVFVFVPSKEIGKIQVVEPIILDAPNARIASFHGGRTLITQTFDALKKIQHIESEQTALCVPDVTSNMYYLKVKGDN